MTDENGPEQQLEMRLDWSPSSESFAVERIPSGENSRRREKSEQILRFASELRGEIL